MPFRCNGLCGMKNHKECQFKRGYSNGHRFCITCDRYFMTGLFRCFCCNQVLRKSKRYNKKVVVTTNFENNGACC